MCKELIDRLKIILHPDRCPSCGSIEINISEYRFDDPYNAFVEERLESCKNCGRIKNHWAYGSFIVSNWREYYIGSYSLRKHIRRYKRETKILEKQYKKENKKIDLDDLPF